MANPQLLRMCIDALYELATAEPMFAPKSSGG
jgi:hypothetical protein